MSLDVSLPEVVRVSFDETQESQRHVKRKAVAAPARPSCRRTQR